MDGSLCVGLPAPGGDIRRERGGVLRQQRFSRRAHEQAQRLHQHPPQAAAGGRLHRNQGDREICRSVPF